MNNTYFKTLGGETDEERLAFFAADQHAENLMLSEECFKTACISACRLPWVDMCCDLLGSNALCPFFLSVAQNSSNFNLDGWVVWCNPPFKDALRFLANIE